MKLVNFLDEKKDGHYCSKAKLSTVIHLFIFILFLNLSLRFRTRTQNTLTAAVQIS